jgi:hypothetical protein
LALEFFHRFGPTLIVEQQRCGSATRDKRHRLFGQRKPWLTRGGGQCEPLAHGPALARIEMRAIACIDQRLDSIAWKLEDEFAPD